MRRPLLAIVFLLSVLYAEAYPTRYRCIWNDDPATTMTIGWDQVGNTQSFVWLSTSREALEAPDEAKVSKHYPDRKVRLKGMHNHYVRLKNLRPNTPYYFRIQDGDGLADIYWFKTAPNDANSRLSFIAGGDSRTFREPRSNGNKMVARLRPHGVIFAGDMIDHGTDEQWQNWFTDWQHTIAEDGRMTPIIAARGNHERSNSDVHRLFDSPSERIYYALEFAGGLMKLYTLNTEIRMSGRQTRWLKNELAASSNVRWHIPQYHKPVRPHIKRKPEGTKQYKHWVPLFEKHHVRLAIESDSHTHKITWPMLKDPGGEEGFKRDDQNGITYIGEGCWGAPLQTNDDDKTWTRDSGRINNVKWIFIDKERIEVRTVMYDNVAEVESVTDDDIFTPPNGLRLKNYGRSEVAVILSP